MPGAFVVWGLCHLVLLSSGAFVTGAFVAEVFVAGAFVVWGFCRLGLLSSGDFVTCAFVAGPFVVGASVAAPCRLPPLPLAFPLVLLTF